jgi:hypothetical protein
VDQQNRRAKQSEAVQALAVLLCLPAIAASALGDISLRRGRKQLQRFRIDVANAAGEGI